MRWRLLVEWICKILVISTEKYLCRFRDQSIFIRIRDHEICNGTTRYFGPSVGHGHCLLWGLTLWGHCLFCCDIPTGSKIIWSILIWDNWLYWGFTSLSYNKRTGPWQIYSMGPTTISDEYFNWAMENFWATWYGAIHCFVWKNQRGRSKFYNRLPLISQFRIPIHFDRSLSVAHIFGILQTTDQNEENHF